MKKTVLLAYMVFSFLVFAQVASANDIEFKYEKIFTRNPEIPHAPLLRLLTYLDEHASSIANKDYITFVNFSLDSDEPRFYVIDMRDGSFKKYLVAHGAGSDMKRTGKARKFSNRVDSHMSSLGIYMTEYVREGGKHPHEMVLNGLEESNDKAEERGILFHGSGEGKEAYVGPGLDSKGRSGGCFVVEDRYVLKIESQIKDGSLLMAWIDPKLLD